ncbi:MULTISPECIES: Rrf2 family transcriptional regulator [unclassified Undibacterium]|uniref:Rrf2 family transcriptional regulator n=1 Tax=unclassified Undibacterium TaxID=2630295 RepID=UPI002AC8AAB7|nr:MULTISPECIES: Rrf2 family transcriptional regulator [unclassified Undibacterium]MEB0139289.1 Rrf2 family transcriptional regulator [Undibacterium sp. CCC2.1]MEB0172133.1 Rrf2 family transcriptional regulator [Undibacterium sp. CCC1.1]MEB0176008.1 Rrf2 family transcriptional regulator [Undibacterium sp. CCC3.4]MEB0215320.1 Rrf2 family transcriptional regulator [Undibacterium sp. 5I2]WPX45493.1 Rrf2 family transcriptional regulator [Undibacterium sp. CCC3.4]
MQLTHFTDLGMRVLIYLSQPEPQQPVTISEIAGVFQVSRNHLVKVVHFMAQQQWIITTRGKGGGLALAAATDQYRLGQIIAKLEGHTELIDCAAPACHLRGQCRLKSMLDQAQQAFYAALDRHTLADAVATPTREAIMHLHQLRFQAY